MNIFHKIALQSLLKSRTRTLVTIIGVILSTALLTAVTTFGVSLIQYMIQGALLQNGNWHVAFLNVDDTFIQTQRQNEEVESCTTLQNIGYARLDIAKNPEKPYVFLTGYQEQTFQTFPVKLFCGRLPENSHEIVVSGKIAADSGTRMQIGDTVTLTLGERVCNQQKLYQNEPYRAGEEIFVPGEQRTFVVTGICQRPVTEEQTAPGYTIITKAEDTAVQSCSLFVTLKKPEHIRKYISQAAKDHAFVMNERVLRFMGLSDNNVFNSLLYAAGGIIIAIIMTGSVFLIYNSFQISLNERTRQFGILMSVGATTRQLRNSVFFEVLCIGAAGIPAGMLVGIFGIWLVIRSVAEHFAGILYAGVPLKITLSLPVLLITVLISLCTIFISALIPVTKAMKTPVMDCIRQSNEIRVEQRTVRASLLVQKLVCLEGTLAARNFRRNRKRYRSVVLSLILSITLFVATSAFAADTKNMSGQSAETTTYDIAFTAKNMGDTELVSLFQKLEKTECVTSGSY